MPIDGWQWKPYSGMTANEEEAYIRKAIEAFKATSPTGKVPVGVSNFRYFIDNSSADLA